MRTAIFDQEQIPLVRQQEIVALVPCDWRLVAANPCVAVSHGVPACSHRPDFSPIPFAPLVIFRMVGGSIWSLGNQPMLLL